MEASGMGQGPGRRRHRQVHSVISDGDTKRDPDHSCVVLWKFTSFTDLVLLYMKVTLKGMSKENDV